MSISKKTKVSLLLLLLGLGASLPGSPQPAAGEPDQPGQVHWAFRPLPDSVAVPNVDHDWARNEIDRFVADRIQAQGLLPSPPAAPHTLLRRLHFTLVGLPPSIETARQHHQDLSESAFQELTDRLLASPAYGERWGRHWLDIARYADTTGDAADAPIPEARRYRDYVIEAFNQDLPYNVFIREQLAGDLLATDEPDHRTRERHIATGFIALSRRFNNGEYRDMHLVIDNTIGTIGRGMLGLTLDCARCHDHRTDPVTIDDYYGLYGYFSSTLYPHGSTESGRQRKNFVDLPGGGVAYAVTDQPDPGDIGDAPVLKLGQPSKKGAIAPRGFIAALSPRSPRIPEGRSGRRQLAGWISSDRNPLTARVMVNRIWHYHFGQGLVPTTNNFGLAGGAPSHPQLLDWLAREFISNNWSVKHIHRLILNSATWRRSSLPPSGLLAIDPANRLLTHFSRQKLEAEPLRDSVLSISGLLKTGVPDQSPLPRPNRKNEYNYTQHRPFTEDYESDHRTIYLPSRRLGKSLFMQAFDGPDTNMCTGRRTVSTIPSQALFWLNSRFLDRNALAMAEKILGLDGAERQRIEAAFLACLSRLPTEQERKLVQDHIARVAATTPATESPRLRAWKSVCRVLLASNEFAYLD